jgi:hypothetical protein
VAKIDVYLLFFHIPTLITGLASYFFSLQFLTITKQKWYEVKSGNTLNSNYIARGMPLKMKDRI